MRLQLEKTSSSYEKLKKKRSVLCIYVVYILYVNARKALERAHKISYLMVLDSFFSSIYLFERISIELPTQPCCGRRIKCVWIR